MGLQFWDRYKDIPQSLQGNKGTYSNPGMGTEWNCQSPIISFSPSMSVESSSGEIVPIFLPMRSVESVRTWLIFAHERLGRRQEAIKYLLEERAAKEIAQLLGTSRKNVTRIRRAAIQVLGEDLA